VNHRQCRHEFEKLGIRHRPQDTGVMGDGVSEHAGEAFDEVGESHLFVAVSLRR
jgi:hypothetical protein